MALSFCFALMSAFILSFTAIPALAGALLSGKKTERKTLLMRFFERIYSPLLDYVLKIRYRVIALALLLILTAGKVYSAINRESSKRRTAVLNGLVLISCLNKLRSEGGSGLMLVKNGAKLRLRAVMMTALTDILGFLPMMLASGIGAEVQKPLAAVVVGGVFTSTILTLIMIPVLYNIFENKMGDIQNNMFAIRP